MCALSTLVLFLVVVATTGCATSQEHRDRKAAIEALSTKTAERVRIETDFKDGGTSRIRAYIDGAPYEFYVDSRIDTRTPGEVYDIYPSERHAVMLDPKSPLAISIKRQFTDLPY